VLSWRAELVGAIVGRLFSAIDVQLEAAGAPSVEDEIRERLEDVLEQLASAHVSSLTGEPSAARELQILEARYRNLRASLSVVQAAAVGQAVRDVLTAGAGILLALV